ncbi:MAG: hypothetical protein KJS92_06895, partial [Bacteroidetes bacterium]|nr:hypothetical protein [Bacteroidota bacterium]
MPVLTAQSIVKLEYFIDKDPGCGKGTRVSFSGPQDTLLKSFSIPTTGLTSGRHFVHVRVQDSSKKWSPWQLQMFMIEDTAYKGPINQVEYFMDKDPGSGKATALSINRADTLRKTFQPAISSLTGGRHFIHVRSRIANGLWSPWQFQMFFIDDTVNRGPIVQAEYFLNKDPGCGKAIPISISSGDSISKNFIAAVSTLPSGRHFIHLRTKIGNGFWSPWQFQMFFIEDTVNRGPIVQAEYFFDKDPACGKATAIAINKADSVGKTFTASISSLTTGRHFIHTRTKIGNGFWSPWQFQMFVIEDTLSLGKPDGYEYFIDRDPGIGKGNKVTVSPVDILDRKITIGTSALSPGYHTFSSRVRIAKGLWSPYQSQLFYLSESEASVKINAISYGVDSSLLNKKRAVMISIN